MLTTQTIGWIDAEDGHMRVEIDLGLDRLNKHVGGQTVEHTTVTEEPVVLSISGATKNGGGQNIDDLLRITKPMNGWTVGDIASLHRIWTRWHLNSMRAACAHMPEDAHARWDAREVVECSAGSGYTYGRAWLVEPLPEDVIAEVKRLQALGTKED